MARTHGRCRRGERLRVGVPHGHWKTTTFVAGLTTRGMIAPFVLGGPINRNAFEGVVTSTWIGAARGLEGPLTSGRGGGSPRPERFVS